MYTRYFGFKEKPFTLTPNPRFIVLSKHHKEAFAHLLYGINNHYGFIELIGEVGTGKTTVLRTLLGQLQDESHRSALIFNPCMTSVELLQNINQEFGIDSESAFANDLLAELNRFLLSENNEGRTVVLVIDEAQNLQTDVLEQVRLISNLETENDKLIQIILAGQPELEWILQRRDLRQLNQRIAVRYKLRSMNRDETRAYIRHRMEVAGETGGVSFSPLSITLIYLFSRGIPRMINIICDRSLLIAYGDERRSIGVFTVGKAAHELLDISLGRRLAYVFFGAALLALLIILGLSLADRSPAWLHAKQQPGETNAKRQSKDTDAIPAATLVAPPPQRTAPAALQASKLERELLSSDQNVVHIKAFNALTSRWGAAPIKSFSGRMTMPGMFGRLAAKRNLKLTAFKGTLDEVMRLDLPFLVVTRVSGKLGGYCLAVTSAQNGSLSISPSLFSSSSIEKDELASLTEDTFYLLWQNFSRIPFVLQQGEKRYEIRELQRLLKQAGFFHEPIDGNYSKATVKAVRDFQLSRGIAANNSAGEVTLAALTRFDANHRVPSLKGN